MLQKISTDSVTRLDSLDVDPISNMGIEHTRDSSIDVDLADGMWNLCLIIHCIGFVSKDHNLVSNAAVVITTTFVFLQVILMINACLFSLRRCRFTIMGMGRSMSLWNTRLPRDMP